MTKDTKQKKNYDYIAVEGIAAKEIDDERNQYFIIAGVLTSTDKFID